MSEYPRTLELLWQSPYYPWIDIPIPPPCQSISIHLLWQSPDHPWIDTPIPPPPPPICQSIPVHRSYSDSPHTIRGLPLQHPQSDHKYSYYKLKIVPICAMVFRTMMNKIWYKIAMCCLHSHFVVPNIPYYVWLCFLYHVNKKINPRHAYTVTVTVVISCVCVCVCVFVCVCVSVCLSVCLHMLFWQYTWLKVKWNIPSC